MNYKDLITTLVELGEVVDSGILSDFKAYPLGHMGGKKVQELESLFCEYFNVKHAISMNSATSCLHSACIALGVRPGIDIITTPVTFSASASCIKMAWGNVRFADIDPLTYNIAPKSISRAITSRTNGIIPVHLHGTPCDLSGIQELNIPIIEDCAQAIGATYHGKKVGTIGKCGIFSFNQGKTIRCGEGGMLITNDDEIARICRLVRNHGETQSDVLGYNYRMTELQAAYLIPQFKRLDEINSAVVELAEYLTELLDDCENLLPPQHYDNCQPVYWTYPLRVYGIDRDEFQDRVAEYGYFIGKGGYKPLHLFPFYGGKEGDYPEAEKAYRTVTYTNIIKPPYKKADIKRLAEVLKSCAS